VRENELYRAVPRPRRAGEEVTAKKPMLGGKTMAGFSKRQSFIFTITIGIAFAGCGGPQQIGQTASPQLQEEAASTPLPSGAVSHRASRALPRNALSGQPLLYVGDDGNGSVDIFPLTGPNKKQIGSISNGMRAPWGLSVDANGSLYVANSGNGTVTVYPYGSSSPSMTYSKGVHEPLYALADSAGHVFVCGRDAGTHNKGLVFEYNVGTNVPIAHARLGSEDDGMAEDASGNLYVAFRHTGPHSSIAEFGPGLSNKRLLGMTINQPQGLLVDSGGNIVVAESASDNIEVFPPGATTPSLTLSFSAGANLAELAMQNSETTLWVSTEGGEVYSMPYPLTPSTVPTEYENISNFGNGIAVSPN
jgi:DNA-binding beta-propeller fold protein YncE